MLKESNCSKRKCKWYQGIKQPNDDELWEFNYCPAFPDGIPKSIDYGDNLHLVVMEGQTGEYTYEQAS